VKPWGLLSVGLLGRLLALLLLTLGLEFFASTVMYERSSRALIRDDEAHRLAEHLVIARKLMSERPLAERPAMAERLTTNRYDIHWAGTTAPRPLLGKPRSEAWQRVVEWEPTLRDSDLHVQLAAIGRQAQLFGALRLTDATWLRFRAIEPGYDNQPGWHRILLAMLPASILLVFSSLLFGRMLRPMRTLVRAVDRVGQGDSSVPEAGPREVRRLIRAFNAMQDRIHRLIVDRTQALAAVGHDLRTPLARMQLRTDAIDDPAVRRAFETDVAEMEAMVGSVLSYLAGDDDPEPDARMDVAVMAATIVDNAADRGGDAIYVGEDHLEAWVKPVSLKRAIGNLVENALHYGQCARVTVLQDGDLLVIRVDDDGPGIPEDRLDEVLHPFSRLDPARARNTKGIGLGLAIVERAAVAHGGEINLANRPEGGLRAELRLPMG
jgi:signal transduction histidine kinase